MNYNDLKWTYTLRLNNESDITQRISCEYRRVCNINIWTYE